MDQYNELKEDKIFPDTFKIKKIKSVLDGVMIVGICKKCNNYFSDSVLAHIHASECNSMKCCSYI
jgi:hypothetical protein